jgi:hypothetical protein
VGAGRKAQLVHGAAEQVLAFGVQPSGREISVTTASPRFGDREPS